MKRILAFLKAMLLGGVIVVLPVLATSEAAGPRAISLARQLTSNR